MRHLTFILMLLTLVSCVHAQTTTGVTITVPVSLGAIALPPTITAGPSSSNVLITAATIGWNTDVSSNSQVCYSTDHAYGTCTTLDASLVLTHSVSLSGLAANTQYFYVVKSQATVGAVTTSSEANFTTAASPTISSILSSNLTATTADISWTTSEAANTQICRDGAGISGGAHATCNSLISNSVTSHSDTFTGLVASSTYYYVVKSTATVGGSTATSSEANFTTVSAGANDAQVPQLTVDTTFPSLAGYADIKVGTGGCGGSCDYSTIAAALNVAKTTCSAGITLTIYDTMTVSTTTTLPVHNCPSGKWIIIRTSGFASLPAQGTRIDPSIDLTNMKTVRQTGTNVQTILVANGVNHYWFQGLEFWTTVGQNGAMVNVDTQNATLANLASYIVIDRCYIHGAAVSNSSSGIRLGGSYEAVVDSYIADFHDTGTEKQGILIGHGNGPYKIDNNFVAAAGQNVFAGGMALASAAYLPADGTVTRNHMLKPLHWYSNDANYLGIGWTVKNIYELKFGKRFKTDGNVFDNHFTCSGSQNFAIVITPKNNAGSGNILTTDDDFIFTNNIVRNVVGGIGLTNYDVLESPAVARLTRANISNNIFDQISIQNCGAGTPRTTGLHITEQPAYLNIQHNVVISILFAASYNADGNHTSSTATKATGNVVKNNYFVRGTNGISTNNPGGVGSPTEGNNTLNWYAPASSPNLNVWTNNVIQGGTAATYNQWETGAKWFPATYADFTDQPNGDYRLAGGSALIAAGTDGLDIGLSSPASVPCIVGSSAYCPRVVLSANPTVSSLGTSSGTCGGSPSPASITVAGTNFKTGTEVFFKAAGASPISATVAINSTIQLTVTMPTSLSAATAYKVFVMNYGVLAGTNFAQNSGTTLTYTCN